eukprot:6351288-Alexandrium_andersonii.AAC.1
MGKGKPRRKTLALYKTLFRPLSSLLTGERRRPGRTGANRGSNAACAGYHPRLPSLGASGNRK